MRKALITGGAGSISSALVRYITSETSGTVVVVDRLTYAGGLISLTPVAQSERFILEKVDICDRTELAHVFTECQPDCIMHPAAGGHVDHSIDGPTAFIETSIVGTYAPSEAARTYWTVLAENKKSALRFHRISTSEVYDDLRLTGDFFTETTPYTPSSPHSMSKASSDHLVRAQLRTYGLPTLITNCSNNYGPHYLSEKLIPLMILNALAGKPLPVYGNEQQVRDRLYVEDHARTLYCVVTTGKVSEAYNIGGHNERKNLDVVETIYELLEGLVPDKPRGVAYYCDLITLVADRPGHDLHYAISVSKVAREFGWLPQEISESGIRKTMQWYLVSESWWKQVQDGSYRGERSGLKD